MEYWGEKLPPRSARSPTSVHVNACALATVRSRRSVTSEEPSIDRTCCCVYTVQPTPRTCPLFFHCRPRAFSSRSFRTAWKFQSVRILLCSIRNGKLRWWLPRFDQRSVEISIVCFVACCDFLPFSSAHCVLDRTSFSCSVLSFQKLHLDARVVKYHYRLPVWCPQDLYALSAVTLK